MAKPEEAAAASFWEKMGVQYLMMGTDALRRATERLETLRAAWADLLDDERREIFQAAIAALDTAETSARAIAGYRGLMKKLDEGLEAAKRRRSEKGDTARAKIDYALEWARLLQEILLEAGVLLTPRAEDASDLVDEFLAGFFALSEPLYTEEELSLDAEKFDALVAERYPRITGGYSLETAEEEDADA